MNLHFDKEELRPLIAAVVAETLTSIQAEETRLTSDRLGYEEGEAARLLGVPRYVLRDARRRGEVHGRPVGRKIVYERGELLRYLRERN